MGIKLNLTTAWGLDDDTQVGWDDVPQSGAAGAQRSCLQEYSPHSLDVPRRRMILLIELGAGRRATLSGTADLGAGISSTRPRLYGA